VNQERVGNQGSHDELLTQGSIYTDLHLLQFSQSEAEKNV
jgi:ABC-type multidrug transport system fused ATPase/permease subunit